MTNITKATMIDTYCLNSLSLCRSSLSTYLFKGERLPVWMPKHKCATLLTPFTWVHGCVQKGCSMRSCQWPARWGGLMINFVRSKVFSFWSLVQNHWCENITAFIIWKGLIILHNHFFALDFFVLKQKLINAVTNCDLLRGLKSPKYKHQKGRLCAATTQSPRFSAR